MPETRPRLLFVDDEQNIRIMLGLVLERNGFSVTTAGTVPEALKIITEQAFDVLIADLNVGHPGDGFTVVSAMRRTQPEAVTFILTGFPAFETALEAIRMQVDDYLTKPTDPDALIETIRAKLSAQKLPRRQIQLRRLADILSEKLAAIRADWMKRCHDDPELARIAITDEERSDHVPKVIQEALNVARGQGHSSDNTNAARKHGELRRQQCYTIPLLLREARLLHVAISQCALENLLAVEISNLLPDLIAVRQSIDIQVEESVLAFLQIGGVPKAS